MKARIVILFHFQSRASFPHLPRPLELIWKVLKVLRLAQLTQPSGAAWKLGRSRILSSHSGWPTLKGVVEMTNRGVERLKKLFSFLYVRKAGSPFYTKLGRVWGVEGTFLSSGPVQCGWGCGGERHPGVSEKSPTHPPPSSHKVLVLGFSLGMLGPWLTTDLPQDSQDRILISQELEEQEGGR